MNTKSKLDPIRDLVIRFAVDQALKVIVSKISFLAFGPLKAIVSFLLTKVLRILIDHTILGILFVYIDIKNSVQVSKVTELQSKIREARQRGASKRELDELDDKLAKQGVLLIKFGTIG